jgi:hypothetical protein
MTTPVVVVVVAVVGSALRARTRFVGAAYDRCDPIAGREE